MHSGFLSPRHFEMLNSAKPSIVYIYKWFTSLCRASIYLRFLQKILSNYSFLCHPLVIKFADAEKTKELCRAISEINWAVMMETISWGLTHSVTPRLRTIIYVSSKILSVFFIKSYERQNLFKTPIPIDVPSSHYTSHYHPDDAGRWYVSWCWVSFLVM